MKIKARVLVTKRIPHQPMEYLFQRVEEVNVNEKDGSLLPQELKDRLRNTDGVLCMLNDRIDREVIDASGRLRVISNYAVGYDNIDVDYASAKGIVVTNTPGVLTDATAELTVALVLAAARRIVEAHGFTLQGRFSGWAPLLFLGYQLAGKVCGIIGAGRIGREVARRLKAFKTRIVYFSPTRKPEFEKEVEADYVSLQNLLKVSDFISVNPRLTPDTYHLLGKKEFELMKTTAVLVNTSRGAVIDEKALAEALEQGKIACAGLDVFENEPGIEEKLLQLPNVVVLPHIGSATYESRNKMGFMAAENLVNALEGKKPPYMVNQ
ncbi:MAG: 2-hydroxyacid dehydrogenase [Spirochaetota bacterium]